MLQNIFLLKGTNLTDINELSIYSYPDEVIKIADKTLLQNIISKRNENRKLFSSSQYKIEDKSLRKQDKYEYTISEPLPLTINGMNLYTTNINESISLGLIFEEEDNPYDYRDILFDTLFEYLNTESNFTFNDELEIENLLLTLFIAIRRYSDEVVQKTPQIEYQINEEFIVKVFLFGIDEVGKTSLIRRLKTGKYNDNYFTPTRKFNIEYIPEDEGFLAWWDMPGQRSFRTKWLMGIQDSNIIIYMIDAANQLRFKEAKEEFWRMIHRFEANDIPILILANKIDLMNHSENSSQQNELLYRLKKEIFDFFEFNKITNRNWKFLFTSVKTNSNINQIKDYIFDLV